MIQQRIVTTVIALMMLIYGCSNERSTAMSTDFNKKRGSEVTTFNVMAPLELTSEEQWQAFDKQLKLAKEMSVDAVSFDVWWGKVESAGDQKFDWSYYHKMVNLLNKHHLMWVPIMSFHQCGGNVGDSCDIPLPTWIWSHFANMQPNDLMFKSEQGNFSRETLSFWQNEQVIIEIYAQYQEFMEDFEREFSDYSQYIQEINISMGPAGELRYPSYNSHDKATGFPYRGAVQGLSDAALQSFDAYIRNMSSMSGSLMQPEINTHYELFPMKQTLDFDRIFDEGAHHEQGISRQFFLWYHQSLLAHGRRMLSVSHASFDGPFSKIPIGYKIPGLHWLIATSGGNTRATELAAGLIAPAEYSRENGWGYAPILSLAKDFKDNTGREVIVHFTALEMDDIGLPPAYSAAKTLVEWVGQSATDLNIVIKGENALAQGVYSSRHWDNIEYALGRHYSGITVLRMSDVVDASRNPVGHARYRQLIQYFSPAD